MNNPLLMTTFINFFPEFVKQKERPEMLKSKAAAAAADALIQR